MTDLQFHILVAIPLAGIVGNTGLFIRLSGVMNTRFARLESKVDSGLDRMESRLDQIESRLTRVGDRIE